MIVVLVGFMGAGKTTVGRALADRLGLPFVDSDALIEQRLGAPIRQVFAEHGESWFREVERVTIAELLAGGDAVLSVGGGALGDPHTRQALRAAVVVHLRVSYAGALARVGGDGRRPMLARADLEQVYQDRVVVYRDSAQVSVDTDDRSVPQIVAQVLAALTGSPA